MGQLLNIGEQTYLSVNNNMQLVKALFLYSRLSILGYWAFTKPQKEPSANYGHPPNLPLPCHD